MLHVPARSATILRICPSVCAGANLAARADAGAGSTAGAGPRTVYSILRIIGLRQERHFVTYHRVLNRAVWDKQLAARLLLDLLLQTFVPKGPVLLGVDDSIERRRGLPTTAC